MSKIRLAKRFVLEEVSNGWIVDFEAKDNDALPNVGDRAYASTLTEALELIERRERAPVAVNEPTGTVNPS